MNVHPATSGSTKEGRYGTLNSTATPDGGAGLRNRDIMDKLLGRELDNRIIDENKLTDKSPLLKRLIPAWTKTHNVKMRNLIYSYPTDRCDQWDPTPPTSNTANTILPLFRQGDWCLDSLAYPRAGDEVDGPVETDTSPVDEPKLDTGMESLTREETERLAAIRTALNTRFVETVVAGSDGGVSGNDESDDSDYSSLPTSSDSEGRDPTYAPSAISSLTSSIPSINAEPEPPAASVETRYARLFNAIATVMSTSFGMSPEKDSLHPRTSKRWFCSTFATLPIPDGSFKRKPDGVLIDRDVAPSDINWRRVVAVLEYTEQKFQLSASVVHQMHMKSYLILRRQPWRTFVLGISLAKNQLRLHYYDRSGVIISCPIDMKSDAKRVVDITTTLVYGHRSRLGYDPTIYINEDLLDQQQSATPSPPTARNLLAVDQTAPLIPSQNPPIVIGWVTIPGRKKLDILGIVWTSDGLVGRGTTCYRVRDPATLQEYALKDYWVDALSIDHETQMLRKLKDIPGVPDAVLSWTVGEEGNVNVQGFKAPQNTIDARACYNASDLSHQMLLAIGNCRVHRRILMTPFAAPIYTFASLKELVWSFLTIAESKFLESNYIKIF